MKKINVLGLIITSVLIYFSLSSNTGGISSRHTAGCGNAGCHGNANTTSIIYFTGIPNNKWALNTTYNCSIKILNTQKNAGGFNLKFDQGTISNASAGTAIVGTNELRHITPKTIVGDTVIWTFDWTSPTYYINNTTNLITLNVAANAVDSNGLSSNDHWTTSVFTFNPAPTLPIIVSQNPQPSITSPYSGILSGSLKAGYASTATIMEYGLTTAYGSSVNCVPANISGIAATSFNGVATGLLGGTTYHCRFAATNAVGTVYSNDTFFTTKSIGLPIVTSSPAGSITQTSAVISGTVNPNFDTYVIAGVEYGTTTAYGSFAPGNTYTINSANNVYVNLIALNPGTVYHYRLQGTNSLGVNYTADRSFKTLEALSIPSVATAAINLYPNPSNGNVQIQLPTNQLIQKIECANWLGQTIPITYIQTTDKCILQLKNNATGLYTLRIFVDDKLFVEKVSIQQ